MRKNEGWEMKTPTNMKKQIDSKAINALCLNCQNRCKQLASTKIIRCPAFKPIEEKKNENSNS